MSEILHITDAGVQAANNASAAGILIDCASFKLGTSNQAHDDTDLDIHGTIIYQGNISFVEALSSSSVRFVFEVPEHVGTTNGTNVYEIAVFLSNGIMFGRATLTTPFVKRSGEGLRINAILNTTRCDLSTINVTIGNYSAVPSCAYVRRLPDPGNSIFNVVSVLDLRHNADGSVCPGIAMKYGAGGNQWAFAGYERVAVFNPDALQLTTNTFTKSGLAVAADLEDNEIVIVQIIGGTGAYAVRKFKYDTQTNKFTENDGEPFLSINTGSTLALWKAVEIPTGFGNNMLPSLNGVPEDWVLTRGTGQSDPIWAPQRTKAGSLNTLFSEPSAMRMSTITVTGNDRLAKFSLGGLTPENANYVYAAVGGITQHRSAFDLVPQNIEFSEVIPSPAVVDLTIFTKEPHIGKRVTLEVSAFVGDGNNLRFTLPQAIESVEYVWVFVSGFKQAITSYTYDSNSHELVFVEAPGAGIAIEAILFIREDDEGYSTKIYTGSLTTQEETYFLELPVSPQNQEQVLVSMNGIHIHNNLYSISDNIIALTGPIAKGRVVEMYVFHNERAIGTPQTNLAGVVTDAILTSKTLTFIRHGSKPVKLPIPTINLEAGYGMRISGTHPNLKIESTLAEYIANTPPYKVSTLHTLNNVEEIIFTHRVELSSNLLLQITADFNAILGPGFQTEEGLEVMEYVIGFRTTQAREPDYGRKIKGTGTAGFCALLPSGVNNRAYSNSSLTQSFEIVVDNIPAKYIDIVAKMRVINANIQTYGSELKINFNLLGIPLL